MATRCCSFEAHATAGSARRGTLTLPHGEVRTPAFMPVGTRGTVKGLTPDEVRGTGADMLLANAYHLWVRPGHERVARLGGLHRMMGWDRPILTDSGGYQAFSLRDKVKLKEEGLRFLSPLDRQWRVLTPEVCVEIQESLGVDVAMALDECIPPDTDRAGVIRSTERTTRWLSRCLASRRHPDRTALFGIVQGGFHADLRSAHARTLVELDLDGYAIGGLSVGEEREVRNEMVRITTPHLPQDRPRYLMGVGYPVDIIEAVIEGVDLFDCVLPTRSGRFAQLFTSRGRMNLRHSRYKDDPRPIDEDCGCYTCRSFSRAYLRHLHLAKEVLAPRLSTLHNLSFYQRFMDRVRDAVDQGPAALTALREEAEGWQRPYEDDEGQRGSDA